MADVCRCYNGKKRRHSGNGDGGKLRDIYVTMYKAYRIMPDVLSKQPPKLLFDVLDGMAEDNTYTNVSRKGKVNYDSPYIRAVFG